MVNPRTRRRGRERAMQFLHGLEFTQAASHESMDAFWEAFPAKPGAREYAEFLIGGVRKHRQTLDEGIDSALRNWSPERVGRVERNILRVALYEMAYEGDVPNKVAINEAIEIAKVYGSDEAPRFINGILDRLKEFEPGKSPA